MIEDDSVQRKNGYNKAPRVNGAIIKNSSINNDLANKLDDGKVYLESTVTEEVDIDCSKANIKCERAVSSKDEERQKTKKRPVKDSSVLKEEWMFSQKFNDSMGSAQLAALSLIGGYAELFETLSGKEIESGYFVSLEGRKIRIANSKDRFILGVTTISPTFLANNGDVRWKNKYITDEWGKILYDEVTIPGLVDEDGNTIIPEHTEKQPKINPLWDKNKQYIPRSLRPEWVPVGLLGQILVRDDGSSKVNGYCLPNDSGIATAASRGYRVLERRNEGQILILLRSNSFSVGNSK